MPNPQSFPINKSDQWLVDSSRATEQQLSAGLAEWQIAEFVDDDKIVAQQLLGYSTTLVTVVSTHDDDDCVDDVYERFSGVRKSGDS